MSIWSNLRSVTPGGSTEEYLGIRTGSTDVVFLASLSWLNPSEVHISISCLQGRYDMPQSCLTWPLWGYIDPSWEGLLAFMSPEGLHVIKPHRHVPESRINFVLRINFGMKMKAPGNSQAHSSLVLSLDAETHYRFYLQVFSLTMINNDTDASKNIYIFFFMSKISYR